MWHSKARHVANATIDIDGVKGVKREREKRCLCVQMPIPNIDNDKYSKLNTLTECVCLMMSEIVAE